MNQPPTLTRRRALRLLGGAVLAAVPAVRFAGEATAARAWCRADPVLRIAGQRAHVYISSPAEMLESATDKIRLTVTLPPRVEGRLLDIAADFGEGYDVRFATSTALQVAGGKVPVLIAVYCPARDGALPVVVELAPVGTGPLAASTAQGSANAWISLRAG